MDISTFCPPSPTKEEAAITEAALAEHRAAETVRILGIVGVPSDPVEREKLAVQVALARRKHALAEHALESLIHPIIP